jgi:hypothetical protein
MSDMTKRVLRAVGFNCWNFEMSLKDAVRNEYARIIGALALQALLVAAVLLPRNHPPGLQAKDLWFLASVPATSAIVAAGRYRSSVLLFLYGLIGGSMTVPVYLTDRSMRAALEANGFNDRWIAIFLFAGVIGTGFACSFVGYIAGKVGRRRE